MRQFDGLRVALTGVFSKPGWGALSVRKEVELELEAWGAIVQHPLTAETDLLVAGTSPSGATLRRAHAYDIETIDLATLRAELEESITRQTALARLRELAREEPSEQGWSRIAVVVERWPDGDSVDVAIDYAERLLTDWPHELRVDRHGWFNRLVRGNSEPRARLVRHAELSNIEDDKSAVLADDVRLSNLAGLWIHPNRRLGDRGLASLLGSPHLSQLTHLTITHCDVSDEGIDALARAVTLGGLRHLKLSSIMLGPVGAATIANSPQLSELRHLDVSSNIIGDLGVRAVAWSSVMARLETLDVSRNHLTDEAVVAIANSPHMSRLTHLELLGPRGGRNNHISKAGVVAMLQSQTLSQAVIDQQRRAFRDLLD